MLTREQYADTRAKIDRYETARRALYPRHNSFTKEMVAMICAAASLSCAPTNQEMGEVELYEFVNDPPVKYFLYIDKDFKLATTWMGGILGRVVFGQEYTGNMRDKRQSVEIYAINGHVYSGTYYKSAGDYARVKMTKKRCEPLK